MSCLQPEGAEWNPQLGRAHREDGVFPVSGASKCGGFGCGGERRHETGVKELSWGQWQLSAYV